MPREEHVVLHPPEEWLRRYVAIALPIVKRAIHQGHRREPETGTPSRPDERATA